MGLGMCKRDWVADDDIAITIIIVQEKISHKCLRNKVLLYFANGTNGRLLIIIKERKYWIIDEMKCVTNIPPNSPSPATIHP